MWSVVGGLTTVIWLVVGGRLFFWSVVGFFHSHSTVVFQIGGSFGRWSVSVVGYFLSKWSVVGGGRSVVGVTVVGGWSVGGGFVLRPTTSYFH